jgi:hypothetical protein
VEVGQADVPPASELRTLHPAQLTASAATCCT